MSFLGRVNIAIARIIMQETGTYNQMFFRPYKTNHVTQEMQEVVSSRLERNHTKGANNNGVNGALFAGIATQIVAPTAAPQGNINIPNGWSEKRIRFVMEVHATMEGSSTQIYYLQGFTNYVGVGNGGAVDERMEFVVNSFVRVTRTMQYSQLGMMPMDNVSQQAQIINGQIINQNIPGQQFFSQRPGDVFCGIQGAYLQQSGSANNITDYRINIGTDAKTTNRVNNVASDYLANIINTYSSTQQLEMFGQSDHDILSRAIDNSYEETPQENPFFRTIASNRGYQMNSPTVFTFAELQKIDPTVGQRTNLYKMGTTMASSNGPVGFNNHYAGRDAFWNSATRETQVATILSNSIPALMMELMIANIWFESSNNFPGSQFMTVIKGAKSLTSAACDNMYELFKMRLVNEILFDLTYGNQECLVLDMCIDLFGETMITISIAGGPSYTYTTPSFCDGLMSPIINDNANGFYGLAHDMEQLCNTTSMTSMELNMPVFNSSI